VIHALHSVLKPGREADYDRVHTRVPDELLSALEESGIREWRIWRSGRHLFHLVECDDFDAALRALDADPRNQRWQAFIGDYVDHFEAPANGLPLVWQLTQQ
jgi:L-rhamnose mutarotase